MNELEARIRDVLLEDASHAPVVVRMPDHVRPKVRRRQAATSLVAAAAALAVVGASVFAVRGLESLDRDRGPEPRPASNPTSDVGEVVHGWPGTGRNPPGVYSWGVSGRRSACASSYCNWGFMHNGYGSGDVEIRIELVIGDGPPGDGATAVTVAGHDGVYRRIDARREEWIVDIEGKTIAIHLEARPGTSLTDLAEAQAIIESMRTEPQDNDLGFRLVFTLTTDDWDSG